MRAAEGEGAADSLDAADGLAAAARREAELVARFRRGDRLAFEELVRGLLPAIRRFLAMRLGDPAEAAEAEQEVLVRLYAALGRFRGEAALSTLVYRISAIAAADLVRSRSRERERSRRLDRAYAASPPPAAPEPGAELERAEAARTLRRALASLGEPAASLLYLRDAEGLSVAELSSAFGLPEGTVKSKLARARAKARAFLLAEEAAASRRMP